MIDILSQNLFSSMSYHGFELVFILGFLLLLAQQRLRYSRQIKKLIEDSPVSMMLVDSHTGRILISNPICAKQLGVRQIGKHYLLPGTLPASFLFELLDHFYINQGEAYRFDWPITANQSISVEIYGRQTQYQGKECWLFNVAPYQVNSNEINQQLESLSVIKSAFEHLSAPVFIKGPDGEKLFINRAFERFWGERLDEGMSDIKGIDKGRVSLRHWTVDLSGRSCLLETHQSLLLSPQGDLLGMLGMSHDVTDWHDMQRNLRDEMEKRRDTEVELAQRETILQNILDASPDSIGIFNQNKVYQACNQPFVKALGIAEVDELIGRRLEDVIPIENYRRLNESDEQVLSQGASLRYVDQVSQSNGEVIWYDVVKTPFRDPVSGTNGALVMARDVTERYLAERQLAQANLELERLSFIDSLTQIANRRRFDEQLELFWHIHLREQQPLTVMLCDIDYFKEFNDLNGHQAGDDALVEVAQAFKRVATRSSDCVARYGGEEFALILPNTSQVGAELIAERIHQQVMEIGLEHPNSKVGHRVTVSIGVVSLTPQSQHSCDVMIAMADSALYQAKANGRNQTCTHHTSSN